MTERDRGALHRSTNDLAIGPSALRWDGDSLVFTIEERTAPFARRIRGTVRVWPEAVTGRRFRLDPEGRHRWSPLAPCARVEVNLATPAARWSGRGYLDSNEGSVPLEDSFVSWNWGRAAIGGDTAIFYDVTPRQGEDLSLVLRIDKSGETTDLPPPPRFALPPTRWRIARETRAETARIRQSLEDAPFYARSVIDCRLLGQPATMLHESLSLRRFDARWVQAMLPFRMPRIRS